MDDQFVKDRPWLGDNFKWWHHHYALRPIYTISEAKEKGLEIYTPVEFPDMEYWVIRNIKTSVHALIVGKDHCVLLNPGEFVTGEVGPAFRDGGGYVAPSSYGIFTADCRAGLGGYDG